MTYTRTSAYLFQSLTWLLFCRHSWQFLNLIPRDFVVKSMSSQTMSVVFVFDSSASKESPSLSSRQYAAQSEPGVTSSARTDEVLSRHSEMSNASGAACRNLVMSGLWLVVMVMVKRW